MKTAAMKELKSLVDKGDVKGWVSKFGAKKK